MGPAPYPGAPGPGRNLSAPVESGTRRRLCAGAFQQVLRRDEGVRIGADPLALVQAIETLDLVARELEVPELEVLLDALRSDRLGEHDVADLDVPAQHDLPGRPAVSLGDLGDHGVVEHLALGQRAPRLGDDAQLLVLAPQLTLLQVGMELDLVDRRRLAGLVDDPVEVVGLEVRHTDGADEPLVARLDERLPGLHVEVLGRHGPVDEVEIHEVELQPLEAVRQRLARVVVAVAVVEALRGDEDVVAAEAGGAEGLADLLLVAIRGGGVDVPVAGLEGLGDRLGGLVGRDLEDPEAELGDLHAVAQGDVGNRIRACAHTDSRARWAADPIRRTPTCPRRHMDYEQIAYEVADGMATVTL